MKQSLSIWQFGGFSFVTLLGSLLHFLYSWTNECALFAPFCAINESTWEHMKLIYFPMLIFSIIQYQYFSEYKSFWYVKLIGILVGLILIPVLFYTYNGVFGKSSHIINIGIFFISVAISFILEWFCFKRDTLICKRTLLPLVIISFICVLFIIFTFYPPKIPLFQDPTK